MFALLVVRLTWNIDRNIDILSQLIEFKLRIYIVIMGGIHQVSRNNQLDPMSW